MKFIECESGDKLYENISRLRLNHKKKLEHIHTHACGNNK